MTKPKDIYLVAHYVMRPKQHVRTAKAGWMTNPANIQYDENIAVVAGLKNRDRQAKVILNLSKAQVEQNGWTGEREFDKLFGYFLENYNEYMTKAMSIANPDFLKAFIEKYSQEEETATESEVGTPPPAEAEKAAS
jgi:hypothetical protein